MSAKGWINGYRCDRCDVMIWTVLIEDGVTPMMLACRGTEGCDGVGHSTWGSRPGIDPITDADIEWEWFKPTDLASLSPEMRDHVEAGGLEIRRAERSALG